MNLVQTEPTRVAEKPAFSAEALELVVYKVTAALVPPIVLGTWAFTVATSPGIGLFEAPLFTALMALLVVLPPIALRFQIRELVSMMLPRIDSSGVRIGDERLVSFRPYFLIPWRSILEFRANRDASEIPCELLTFGLAANRTTTVRILIPDQETESKVRRLEEEILRRMSEREG